MRDPRTQKPSSYKVCRGEREDDIVVIHGSHRGTENHSGERKKEISLFSTDQTK